jgi:AbrB family looped-hinge helix DNA binding protein
MIMYAKISKKGQVTIPKAIREKLEIFNEGAVLFLVEDDEVKLKGIPGAQADQLGGSLKEYAKEYVPLSKIRTKIKGKIADEIARESLSD